MNSKGKKTKAKIFFIIFMISCELSAWIKEYDRPLSSLNLLTETTDNGFIISDRSSGADVLKADSLGNIIWSRTVNHGNSGRIIQSTFGGGCFIAYGSVDNKDSSFHIIKLDAEGNHLWKKDYPCEGKVLITAMIKTIDNCFVLTINGYHFHSFMKIKDDGTVLWYRKTSEPIANESLRMDNTCLFQFSDGNYLELSIVLPLPSFNEKLYSVLVKRDTSGNIIWKKSYFKYNDQITEFIHNSMLILDDGYLITGSLNINNDISTLFLKTDLNGDSVWTHKHNTYENIRLLHKTESGYSIVAQFIDPDNLYLPHLLTLDSDYHIVNTKKLPYDSFNLFQAMLDDNGDYIFLGKNSSTAALIKIDSEFGDVLSIPGKKLNAIKKYVTVRQFSISETAFSFSSLPPDEYPLDLTIYDIKGNLIKRFVGITNDSITWYTGEGMKGVLIYKCKGKDVRESHAFSLVK